MPKLTSLEIAQYCVSARRIIDSARSQLGYNLMGGSVRDLLLDNLNLPSADVDRVIAMLDRHQQGRVLDEEQQS